MKTYTAIYAIPELLIIFIGVAFTVWLLWRAWADARKAALDQAWHEVLDEVTIQNGATLKSANA